ncbi:hypothetical protein PR202_ga17600 [Eleusine coracana subsp. coracana]|uniref:Uncharacterized protein n=1 Tax=Eleusine coracana subsp. coracana TaxID=191504 RepID=A0AAV5CPJ4_ELECO|nr:hypothetical protein QOZ80_6AG0515310 [Eleusine coracana subsp. coracana]GJN00186.1 hypothetical protein PR202_ga17353 [Eleusine coracana subsp. coracana]GJN00418.1 hypothetical protein PR202_ga17600 [Eleusine coracana subsp. coracana]
MCRLLQIVRIFITRNTSYKDKPLIGCYHNLPSVSRLSPYYWFHESYDRQTTREAKSKIRLQEEEASPKPCHSRQSQVTILHNTSETQTQADASNVASPKGNSSYVSSLTVDGDDSLYVASSDGHLRLWPLDMATDVEENEHSICTVATADSSIKCLLATNKGLVSAHQDGKIRVWHTGKKRNGTRRLNLRAVLPTAVDCLRTFLLPKNYVEVRRHWTRTWVHHVDAVTAFAMSPDGLEMYSVSWDRSLKAWRMDGLRCVESIAAAHDDAINAVAVSPDGHVFTGSADKTIKAWRRHPGQRWLALVGTMGCHKASVNALALGIGGQVLYSGACDKTVIVWELAGGAMTPSPPRSGGIRRPCCAWPPLVTWCAAVRRTGR